ncbi:SHC-transforming protein 1 [Heterocephalus glaber]|uniref:SHC-transforming protein 1 n=1 Tax=Heterocephalus glaber TaxID=10181 RepID=G5BEY6_HETGA|nr:SHC-transforming protein 1 [Heterocephalus glaber]
MGSSEVTWLTLSIRGHRRLSKTGKLHSARNFWINRAKNQTQEDPKKDEQLEAGQPGGGGHLGPKGEPGRAAEDGEGITGTAVLDSGPLPLLQDMNKLNGGSGHRTRVEGGQLGGEEWTHQGSFVNKPMRGWLHPNNKVTGPEVSYLVRYMGCVEVLQSARALDFNTWTQVTREAISLVCEAVPGAKGATRRRKPCSRPLSSVLGRSNLKFAGMPVTLTVSTSSLNLRAAGCKQIANHHVQSISFVSGGDPDTADVPRDLFNMKPFEDALRVPPPPQLMSMAEQLQGEPWFHGKQSRREAEALLQLKGDFLVQESTTTPGQYVLNRLQSGQPKHLLLVDPEGVVRTKDHGLESVSHLISYHMDNPLPIISAGTELCLQQPVERKL